MHCEIGKFPVQQICKVTGVAFSHSPVYLCSKRVCLQAPQKDKLCVSFTVCTGKQQDVPHLSLLFAVGKKNELHIQKTRLFPISV